MKQAAHAYRCYLVNGGKKTEVEIRYASRYSAIVILPKKLKKTSYDNLEILVGDKIVEAGPCLLMEENNEYRLIAYKKLLDFDRLFFKAKVENLETESSNLSLVLNYKNTIDPAFCKYVAGLTYDLSVYSILFDQIDAKSMDEPQEIREYIQKSVIGGIGETFLEYMETKYDELKEIVSNFTEENHEHHGYYFRRQLWSFLLRSPIMARTNLKPRGYIGDSEMMRMLYTNEYAGDSTLGKILHKFSCEQPAAQAVRNRRGEISRMILENSAKRASGKNDRFRVLSVACGPAIEVSDILLKKSDCDTMHFSLLDQDEQALLECATLIGKIEKSLNSHISTDFIRESVRTLLVTPELKDKLGQYHFIYSMGLFDYLTAPVASAVINKLYQLLYPNSTMVIGNMAVGNSSQFYMEYWHDWKIIYRNEEDMLKLAKDLPGSKAEVCFDETGIQMLLRITKEN